MINTNWEERFDRMIFSGRFGIGEVKDLIRTEIERLIVAAEKLHNEELASYKKSLMEKIGEMDFMLSDDSREIVFKSDVQALLDEDMLDFFRTELASYKQSLKERIEVLPRHLVQRYISDPTIVAAVTIEDISLLLDEDI